MTYDSLHELFSPEVSDAIVPVQLVSAIPELPELDSGLICRLAAKLTMHSARRGLATTTLVKRGWTSAHKGWAAWRRKWLAKVCAKQGTVTRSCCPSMQIN